MTNKKKPVTNKKKIDWEDLLRAAAEFQKLVPAAVLVGGTGSAIHAGHRISYDADHVLSDLAPKFEELLELLEAHPEWQTNRVLIPKLILGNFKGVETGLRQLIRNAPLETTCIKTKGGEITLPSPGEMLRIKGWLIVTRNAVRDYIDFVALSQKLGRDQVQSALASFDSLYKEVYAKGSSHEVSPLLQLARQLADPQPYDLTEIEISTYKGIAKPWDSWENIRAACISIAPLAVSFESKS